MEGPSGSLPTAQSARSFHSSKSRKSWDDVHGEESEALNGSVEASLDRLLTHHVDKLKDYLRHRFEKLEAHLYQEYIHQSPTPGHVSGAPVDWHRKRSASRHRSHNNESPIWSDDYHSQSKRMLNSARSAGSRPDLAIEYLLGDAYFNDSGPSRAVPGGECAASIAVLPTEVASHHPTIAVPIMQIGGGPSDRNGRSSAHAHHSAPEPIITHTSAVGPTGSSSAGTGSFVHHAEAGAFEKGSVQSQPEESSSSASPGGMFKLQVRREWLTTSRGGHQAGRTPTNANTRAFNMHSQSEAWLSSEREDTVTMKNSTWRYWLMYKTMITPSSPFQLTWEMVAIFLVLFDMFELPVQLFDPPESQFVNVMQRIGQIFWNVDLFLSFRMGYISSDEVVMDPRRCAKHYIMTWFPFDILIVGTDWVLFILDEVEGYVTFAKAGKTLKVLRAARTMKMLRMLKIRKAFSTFEDHVIQMLSGSETPVLGILKFCIGLLFICHFLCSIWYAVGVASGDRGWTRRYEIDILPFWERYLLSLHWALAQFGVGGSDYFAATVLEFLVNISILLAGLLVTALLVSSITNTFSVMQQQTADQYHQMWLLRRFCMDHELPRSLAKRIAEHVEGQLTNRRSAIEMSDVKLLSLVSRPLQAEVTFFLYLPNITSHPFLAMLCRDYHYNMRQVATQALSETPYAEGDMVFTQGTVGKQAWNIQHGTMRYFKETLEEVLEADDQEEEVGQFHWIAEAVMWVEAWQHRGDLVAKSPSQCLVLDPEKFCEHMCRHADTFLLAQAYAQARVDEMSSNETSSNDGVQLSDIALINKRCGFMYTTSNLQIPEAPDLSRKFTNHFEPKTPAHAAWYWVSDSIRHRYQKWAQERKVAKRERAKLDTTSSSGSRVASVMV